METTEIWGRNEAGDTIRLASGLSEEEASAVVLASRGVPPYCKNHWIWVNTRSGE